MILHTYLLYSIVCLSSHLPFRQILQEVLIGGVVQSPERTVIHRKTSVVHGYRAGGRCGSLGGRRRADRKKKTNGVRRQAQSRVRSRTLDVIFLTLGVSEEMITTRDTSRANTSHIKKHEEDHLRRRETPVSLESTMTFGLLRRNRPTDTTRS